MSKKTDLSVLEPFLRLESFEWGDVVRFGDDVLAMADAANALEHFRHLLEDLQHCEGRPLVLWGTDRSFSPQRCNALLRDWGNLCEGHAGGRSFASPLLKFAMTREENFFGGLIRWLRSVKRPVIKVFQGDISLSFLGIGLACDYRIATSETTFYNQGLDLDMPPGSGLLYLLPAYLGLGRANTLVTRIPEITAQSAYAWGLLDEVVVPAELGRTVQRMATGTSCLSAGTRDTIKQLLNHHLPSLETYFELEAHGIEMALHAKPWERLADEETEDAARK